MLITVTQNDRWQAKGLSGPTQIYSSSGIGKVVARRDRIGMIHVRWRWEDTYEVPRDVQA